MGLLLRGLVFGDLFSSVFVRFIVEVFVGE